VLTSAFCGSVHVALALTCNGGCPLLGETDSVLGGSGGLLMVTAWEADPVKLALSVAVTVTVKVPAFV
jgi:hypothetical protein